MLKSCGRSRSTGAKQRVAAEYGCTPANIDALLCKPRRVPDKGVADATSLGKPPELALHTPVIRNQAGSVGVRLAKPGFRLAMRTADGNDGLTPFRSPDDLLSAVKPILHAAARSQDMIWFFIQPIDLASLDSDTARWNRASGFPEQIIQLAQQQLGSWQTIQGPAGRLCSMPEGVR